MTFDRKVIDLLLVDEIRTGQCLGPSTGRLVYSNVFPLIDQEFELSADHRRILAEGGTGSALSDADDPENQLPRTASSRTS